MTSKVVPVSKCDFYKYYKVREVDLFDLGLFNKDDITFIERYGETKTKTKIKKLISDIPFYIKYPNSFIKLLLEKFTDIDKAAVKNSIDPRKYKVFDKCNLKVSIASAFKPRNILEIGTHIGCTAAAFKFGIKNVSVYTINISGDTDSDNPISTKYIGAFCKRKKIKVNQFFADSTKYNYSNLQNIDVTYIDGNHGYDYVYKDINNTVKITGKCIILDDYVPKISVKGNDLIFSPWNEGVVQAVDDFLIKNPYVFKNAYWIINSPYCVLIK